MKLPRATNENTASFVPGWAWNLIVGVIERVMGLSVAAPLTLSNTPSGIRIGIDLPDEGHWAKVNGNTQQVNDDDEDKEQWAYATKQVYKKDAGPGGWAEVDGGIETFSADDATGPKAWNTLEDMNGLVGSGMTGAGIDTSQLPPNPDAEEGDPPSTFTLSPVPSGAIVWLRKVHTVDEDGNPIIEYHFTAANGLGGTCPTDGEGSGGTP